MRGPITFQRPMTVFWSRARRQCHVTICLMKFAVGERNVAIRYIYFAFGCVIWIWLSYYQWSWVTIKTTTAFATHACHQSPYLQPAATKGWYALPWRNLTQWRSFTLLSVWTVKISNLKIQDGGGRHFEKSKNRHISAMVWTIWTKFGTATHFDPLEPNDH